MVLLESRDIQQHTSMPQPSTLPAGSQVSMVQSVCVHLQPDNPQPLPIGFLLAAA